MKSSQKRNEPDSPKLLYIHMCALGDAIMASPALRILKEGLPHARVCVLARSHVQKYFRTLPYVDEVVPFIDERHVDRMKPLRLLGRVEDVFRLIKQLRTGGYEAAIQWRGQLPDTLMSVCTGARHRVAGVQSIHRRARFPVERLSFLVTDLVPVTDRGAHLVEAMAAPARFLVEKLGGKLPANPNLSLDYPLQAADHVAAAEFMNAHGLQGGEPFALVCISARSAVNTWPDDRWSAIADHLQSRQRVRVVLTGLPDHQARETAIVAMMRTKPICSIARIPFGVECALLARSRLLVSLNTGISHIAAALQVPVVVLSGNEGASITPWGTCHYVVTRNSFYPQRHPDRRQWRTLVPLITVEDVTKAIDSILSESYVNRG